MSNQTIPPTPYQSPLIDKNGLLTVPWANWFKQLYLRSGGFSAPSITLLEANITTLQTDFGVIQTDIATIDSTLTTLTTDFDGLSVGRQL